MLYPTLFEETKTVVLKTNNNCNLKCSYCYDDDNKDRTLTNLDIDIIPSLFQELVVFSKQKNIDRLNVIWHGGEPMLMGLDYFSDVTDIQKKLDFGFNNLIQTNGVYIDDEWISFFKKNQFKIGISFDGAISANKIHRQKTNDVVKNIKLLNKHSIAPSLICVISDLNYTYYEEMFKFLSGIETEYVDLIPCYENNKKFSLSNQHYIEFMIGMFDLWWKSDRKINFRFFNNIIDKIQGKISHENFVTCSLTGRCGEIISVNSDKKIYFCDCLPKNETYHIGTLTDGLSKISDGYKYSTLREKTMSVNSECKDCKFLSICGQGCMNRRESGNNMKDYYCEARKVLFNHIMLALGTNEICCTSKGIPAFTRGPEPITVN